MFNNKIPNISLFFTLLRLLISPIIIPISIIYLFPYSSILVNSILAGIFVLFCITDFLDGFYARRYHQETVMGRMLDPIADKFLNCSALIALLVVQKIYFFWVILFIGRDFFIMGLRAVALEYHIRLPVIYLAKIKTGVQMFFITFLIAQPEPFLYRLHPYLWVGEKCLLCISLLLSLATAYYYYKMFLKQYAVSNI